jgi:hypothetical protein
MAELDEVLKPEEKPGEPEEVASAEELDADLDGVFERLEKLEGERTASEGEGEKTLRLALAEFLRSDAVGKGKAVSELAKYPAKSAAVKEKELEHSKTFSLHSMHLGIGFSAFVLETVSCQCASVSAAKPPL